MNAFSRSSALAGIAAVALAVAGCGGDNSMSGMSMSATSPTTASTPASSTSVLNTSPESMPGMPSMSDTPSAASSAAGGGEVSAEHNAADVTFAQGMLEHHRGAVEMAQLAPDRAQSQQVKDLAARIEAAQGPEIGLMTGWLQAWGAATPGTGGMDMGDASGMDMGETGGMDMSTGSSGTTGMPGMMTAEQMAALTASTGAAFDTMFLEMMVLHHQGALQMAEAEIADGANPEALVLAEEIRTSQTAEIAEMQELLATM